MTTVLELWKEKRNFLADKSISQIINMSGEGVLKDGSVTSLQVRELLNEVPSDKLKQFANQCLEPFKDSGFALQDVINQFGRRLGFTVEHGLYRGKVNEIGFDGIWRLKNEYSFILEIKTTDAYRINLDTIAVYTDKLIESGKIEKNKSSILIVVGRQDTGDLEAQIRGSRHAWNIRVLSIDALSKLLDLRESVNDNKILSQINEILKPLEFTRLDKLIDLLFITAQDNEIDEEVVIKEEINKDEESKKSNSAKEMPVDFHEACINKISARLDKTFIKQSKSTFLSSDNTVGLTCAVSKNYPKKNSELYWYAFHPHQKEFLEDNSAGYVSFGCGNENKILLIPSEVFLPLTANLNKTVKDTRFYWHIKIHCEKGKYELEQPHSANAQRKDISQYLI